MAKKWNINAILSHDNSNFDYKFDITYNGQTHTLFNSDTFKKRLLYTYTSWCLFSPGFYDPVTDSYINTVDDINDAINLLHDLFTEWVQNRQHAFSRMYAALVAEYNPLWNVDGVEGLMTKTTHTGTSANAHTGKDTMQASGNDTVSNTGTDTDTLSGTDTIDHDVTKDENTRTGSEANARTGNDTDTRQVATFDSGGVLAPESSNRTDYASTDTKTYTNVKDSREVDEQHTTTYGKVDTFVHGKIETTAHGKKDETTYNSTNTETRNLVDEYLELKIRQGNIGLTKSTELVESEMRLRRDWDNMINEWIKDFISSYCIL